MEPFVLLGLIGGLYSCFVSAVYLRFRKEGQTGVRGVIELLKWAAWCGFAMFAPMAAMQFIDETYRLNLVKAERGYALAIWLGLIWSYFFFAAYRSWKKGTLKILGPGGKVIYEGRNRNAGRS